MTIGKLLVERLGAAEPAAESPLVLADASHSVELSGRPPPNQRDRPPPSAGSTHAKRRFQSMLVIFQLRPASSTVAYERSLVSSDVGSR
mgnify:CR=1 FL=1